MITTSIKDYKNSLELLTQYPSNFMEMNNVIKLSEDANNVSIGIAQNTNHNILEILKQYHKEVNIDFVNISSSELASYISKSDTNNELDTVVRANENDLTRLANDAPIINLVNSILIDGINMDASDIHIEGYKNSVVLRFRVDGILIESEKININLFPSISSRIKIMSNLNIMERRQPQDGRISVTLEGREVDLRISIVPLSGGESIVLRLFVKKDRIISLEDLGYYGNTLKMLNSVIGLPYGLVLITGPTGSGKTTTLNAMLQQINSCEKKIITIEDPVEYTVPGISQIQVNSEIGLDFSTILRRVLRQDPDIIMIGEIRDKQTAELVIRAALTGHLVISTLHTNDASSVIPRLKDLGIPLYLITSVLRASFAQRLVRTLCRHCMGKGCKNCLEKGLKGRIAISEGFLVDEELETLILNDAKLYEINNHLYNKGMLSLYKSGLSAVESGLTTLVEINRVLRQ